MVEVPTGSAPPAPPAAVRLARAVPPLAALVLVLTAIALLAVSFAPYETVKNRLDAYASDHDADLSADRFGTIVWQLRLLAAGAAIAGAAALGWRRRLARLVAALLGSAARDATTAARALRHAVASESRLHLGALGLVVAVATLVRLEFLFQPMRYDESGTYVHYASHPLYIGLTAYTAPNNHLLNTLLIHLSTGVFGNPPWAIRLPALVAGILLVPAAYLAARAFFGRNAALIAAGLVAASSPLIEYSTNARGYTFVALLFVLLLALAAHLRSSSSPAAWAAFALLAALGLFAVPTFVYALATVVAWLAWALAADGRLRALRRRLLASLAATAAVALVLYAPAIAASGPRALTANPFVVSKGWTSFAAELPASLASTFASWHRDQPAPLWVALAIAFLAGVLLHKRASRLPVPPAAAALVAIPPLLLVQRVVPFERAWLFLLPLYLITAAAGLLLAAKPLERRAVYGPVVALAAVVLAASLAAQAYASQAVYESEETSTFRDAPEVARFLERTVQPGDRILAAPPADLILEYYLGAAGLDAGRLLYTDFKARRLFAVVKQGPREFSLADVIERNLEDARAADFSPVLLRRYPESLVYELRPRG